MADLIRTLPDWEQIANTIEDRQNLAIELKRQYDQGYAAGKLDGYDTGYKDGIDIGWAVEQDKDYNNG